jgi:hypothetical protein
MKNSHVLHATHATFSSTDFSSQCLTGDSAAVPQLHYVLQPFRILRYAAVWHGTPSTLLPPSPPHASDHSTQWTAGATEFSSMRHVQSIAQLWDQLTHRSVRGNIFHYRKAQTIILASGHLSRYSNGRLIPSSARFLSSPVSRPALGLTQPPIQWILGPIPWE